MSASRNVFDDRTRADRDYAQPGESTWSFLDRMAGDYWSDLRALVSAWAGNVAPEPRKKIVGMLRSGTDGQFEAGFFELYVHECLLRAGYDLEVEPAIDGTDRRPDFRASRDGDQMFIECTAVGGTTARRAQGKRFEPLQAALNKLKAPGVILRIELDAVGTKTLPEARLRKAVGKWLATLDVANLPLWSYPSSHLTEAFSWAEDDWMIRLHPSRLAPESPAVNARRVMVVGPVYTERRDDSGSLLVALRNKGNRYGPLSAPFIVAINAISGWPGDDDVLSALYGPVQFPIHAEGTVGQAFRGQGGYWWSDGPQHRDVSGVLVTKGLNPWSISEVIPTLWLNAHARRAARPIAPWRTSMIVNQQAKFVDPVVTHRQHFGLAEPWPRGDAFPTDDECRLPD